MVIFSSHKPTAGPSGTSLGNCDTLPDPLRRLHGPRQPESIQQHPKKAVFDLIQSYTLIDDHASCLSFQLCPLYMTRACLDFSHPPSHSFSPTLLASVSNGGLPFRPSPAVHHDASKDFVSPFFSKDLRSRIPQHA